MEDAACCIEALEEFAKFDDTEYQIKKAYITYRARNYEKAVQDFDAAWRITNEDGDIDEETKTYLLRYISVPANIALQSLNAANNSNVRYNYIDDSIEFDVNEDRVSKKWRDEFPFRKLK